MNVAAETKRAYQRYLDAFDAYVADDSPANVAALDQARAAWADQMALDEAQTRLSV